MTIETFLEWKAKFDAEIAEVKRQRGEKGKVSDKLTGLWQMDFSLMARLWRMKGELQPSVTLWS